MGNSPGPARTLAMRRETVAAQDIDSANGLRNILGIGVSPLCRPDCGSLCMHIAVKDGPAQAAEVQRAAAHGERRHQEPDARYARQPAAQTSMHRSIPRSEGWDGGQRRRNCAICDRTHDDAASAVLSAGAGLSVREHSIMGARKSGLRKSWGVMLALAVCGFANISAAQETQKLFIEGDIVRGNTPAGITGPVCVLANQFKRKERVVFRIRVRDIAGEPLDDQAIKGIVVEMSDGQKFPAEYRSRPPLAVRKALGLSEPTDYFWSAVWQIPPDYPTGSLSYKVVATDMKGNTQSWTPFKDPRSLPIVMAGEVEYTK
jgi:hypothetical protein